MKKKGIYNEILIAHKGNAFKALALSDHVFLLLFVLFHK